MPCPDKSPSTSSLPLSRAEISTQDLLQQLARHAAKPLVFAYEGRDVLPGYHVTEVKSGAFEGLDCGANEEAWRETFIQLWDVAGEPGRSWMPSSKFLAIMGKVTDALSLGEKLTFEVSDGVGAMRLYRASAIEEQDGTVRVQLSRRPSSCKPRDRWLEQQPPQASCRPANAKAACCG
jgi:hypothetical protein